MKIGICLIVKDENDYLKEWMDHHRKIGVDHFFIYDNNSKIPVGETLLDEMDVTIKHWMDEKIGSQCRAYEDCCRYHSEYDYIAFIDTDEFIMMRDYTNLKDYINAFPLRFDALAMSWRMYGQPQPYFTERQPIENYTHYYENEHVKCLINPKKVNRFPDPHRALMNGICIDELGNRVNGPWNTHTSKTIWIKHIWTRSEPEFAEKIKRGDANKVIRNYSMNDFYNHNDKCLFQDVTYSDTTV